MYCALFLVGLVTAIATIINISLVIHSKVRTSFKRSQAADYPKVWPFPTKSLATSTTTSKKLCLIQMFVLGWRKGR